MNKKVVIPVVSGIIVCLGVLIVVFALRFKPESNYVGEIEAATVNEQITKITVLKLSLDALNEPDMNDFLEASNAALDEIERLNASLQVTVTETEVPDDAIEVHNYLRNYVNLNTELVGEMRLMLDLYAGLTVEGLTEDKAEAIYSDSIAQMNVIANLAGETDVQEDKWLVAFESLK